ncbi:protein FAR1-RELATED SEQUENCE 5-like [Camellia sinensis]|uniref:protein FAR1-RELATED SEQUENCE 5-like n=1 Tax=Camellia sinensis TaxID=4442 RepID=UPI001035B24B|nr:protein FAR1-RELATED SEQUENCE 5-like [Camellia sinensis]
MLEFGEAGSILKYFQDQTVQNPSFFYSVQLDTEEQITNIFWADARMIIDYGQFGDVVTFDTTYKINRESRPFPIFVGFNNHRETIVFGAALMYDETTDSFIWLFKTFLEAMSNKLPKTIFTDQDAAMAKAISYVMPNTYHRLCTWHMMQNAIKHMSGIFSGPGGVRSVLGKFIDAYEEEEEFFAAWNAMLDEFDVHDNSWLQSIFHLRKKWVRAYVRWTWSAGMKSTQLSESLNVDLKEYLRSDYNLIQFFIHFERVLNEKRYKEYEAEYALSYKLPRIKVQVLMLTQAGDVYTKTIFEEFQDEYVGSLELYVANCVHKDDCLVYIVKAYRQSTMREVKKDKDGNLSCSCRLFEMKGILCSHVIKVLKDEMIIMEIPSQYILKRWTKLARVEIVQDYKGRDIQADPKLEQSSRYKSLCSLFTMISSQASELEETYEDCVQEGKKLLAFVQNKLRIRITNGPLNLNDASSTMRMNEGSENVIQAKGLKKRIDPIRGRRRIKSSLEKALETSRKKKQRDVQASSNILPHMMPPYIQVPTSMQDIHVSSNILPHMRQPLAEVPNSVPWTWNGEPQYANFRALLQGFTLLNSSQCSTSTYYNQVPNLNIVRNSSTPIYPEILGDR